MDTESVRLFVLAAKKLNISAAGRALGMAPAAASSKLAKLENTLGTELLHRSTRKVALSLEGQEFLPFAEEMLAQEDAALEALGHGQASPSGTLRFAASSTFAQLYIVPILPKFLAQYPQIKLDLRLSDTAFDLLEGSFDLALRNQVLNDSSLRARRLANDTRILCASPGYLKQFGTPQTPEELTNHQLIGFQKQSARQLLAMDGRVAQFDPHGAGCRLIVDDGLSQKLATTAGAGISANSLWSIYHELQSGQLMRVLPNFIVDDQVSIWLVYPKSNVLSAKVRVFIDFLIDEIQNHPVWNYGLNVKLNP